MTQIIPTITAFSPEDFAREFLKLDFAPRIHIDISDGIFAPSKTVNLNQVYFDEKNFDKKFDKNPRKNLSKNLETTEKNSREFDLHLMMENPQNWLHQIISLAPNRVIFHAEIKNAREILLRIFAHLKKFGIKCGIAILPETAPENVREIIEISDQVLIFGGHLGFQGGKANLENLKKAEKIREIWRDFDEKNLAEKSEKKSQNFKEISEKNLSKNSGKDFENSKNFVREISWDGGANFENVAEIAKFCEIINVGSAISKSENPEKSYENLLKIANENSIKMQ